MPVCSSWLHSAFHRIQTIKLDANTAAEDLRCTPLFIAFKPLSAVRWTPAVLGCTPLFIAFKRSHAANSSSKGALVALRFSSHSNAWKSNKACSQFSSCTPLFIAFKQNKNRTDGGTTAKVALRFSSHSNKEVMEIVNEREWVALRFSSHSNEDF